MKFKKALAGIALSCAGLGGSFTVHGAEPSSKWPTKPVHIVVTFQAGGSADVVARALAAKLSQTWGQPVVVENKPGANGILATQYVLRAEPDGYTLLYHLTGAIQNPLLYKSAGYDPIKDLAPIVQVGTQPMGLAVPAKSPINTLQELIGQGRSLTRGQSYGSVGIGHTGHIWSELLVSENGMKGTHAVYKGTSPLLIDLTTGRLDWAFLASADAAIRSEDKSLKVLALTGDHRIQQLPGVATMKELGQPGFDMVGWHAVFGRSGTPRETLSKIEADLKKALAEPDVRKTLDIQGIEVTGIGGAAFASVVRNDYQRWGELIRRFDIRNE